MNFQYVKTFSVPALSLSLMTGTAPQATAEVPQSQISVPLVISMGNLQSYVDSQLPTTLHHNEYGRTCIESEQICTDVPEFHGLEITMGRQCVDISPAIDCTISEDVYREGPIGITGNGSQIVITQTIFGAANVRGRGEIGKHISQTVRARASVTITAQPGIQADWSPRLPLSITYDWIERPEFRLFNLFPITLGSTLGPPLDAAIRKFKNNTLPSELARLNLHSEAQTLWTALQAPIPLDLAENRRAYLHLRPDAVALEGPLFDSGALTARLALSLRAMVDENETGPQQTLLPNLTELPDTGVSLTIPARLSLATLEAVVAEQLPLTIEIENPTAALTINEVRLSTSNGALVFDLQVEVKNGGVLNALSGALQVQALPELDAEAEAIHFRSIGLSDPDGGFAAGMRTLSLRIVERFLDDVVTVAFGTELDQLEIALNEALNRPLTPELSLSGEGTLEVVGLSLVEASAAIEVVLRSTGRVLVSGFNPLN